MDHIDRALLELLQHDGRITISELSKKLALSRPSVSERIARLEERGVIEHYSARVAHAKVGLDILLFIQVSELKIPHLEFENLIAKEEAVLECHRVTGPINYLLKAAVPDMNGMRELIDRLIPYGAFNTSTVLTSPVAYRALLPREDQ